MVHTQNKSHGLYILSLVHFGQILGDYFTAMFFWGMKSQSIDTWKTPTAMIFGFPWDDTRVTHMTIPSHLLMAPEWPDFAVNPAASEWRYWWTWWSQSERVGLDFYQETWIHVCCQLHQVEPLVLVSPWLLNINEYNVYVCAFNDSDSYHDVKAPLLSDIAVVTNHKVMPPPQLVYNPPLL